jgi:hypothetical protein
MKLLRGRYHQYAVLSIVGLLSACGPTYSEQMATIRQRSFDAEVALDKKQAAEVERLFQICNADVKEFWARPKPPLLKSCIEYQAELKHGIMDKRAEEECNGDMMEEIPSCKKWNTAGDNELERLKMNQLENR